MSAQLTEFDPERTLKNVCSWEGLSHFSFANKLAFPKKEDFGFTQ
jgi:hypothetical protein